VSRARSRTSLQSTRLETTSCRSHLNRRCYLRWSVMRRRTRWTQRNTAAGCWAQSWDLVRIHTATAVTMIRRHSNHQYVCVSRSFVTVVRWCQWLYSQHSTWQRCLSTLGDFNFRLGLSLSLFAELKFGLSPDLSQKVKWFHWAKVLGQIYGLSTYLDRS